MLARTSLFLCLLWTGLAQAHDSSISHSLWTLDGTGAEVRLRVSERDIRDNAPQDYTQALRLLAGDASCTATGPAADLGSDGRWHNYRWLLRCTVPPAQIESLLFPRQAPAHLHIAHIEWTDGASAERMLNASRPRASLLQPEPDQRGFSAFVLSGIEHILLGWDHLAFLALLFLLATGRMEILLLITGFTLAHSLTLGATAMGWLSPEAAAIEALIAFSILLVAIENSWQLAGKGPVLPAAVVLGLLVLAVAGSWSLSGPALLGLALFSACYFLLAHGPQATRGWRALLVLLFGLAHGCGFAGALLEVGLPAENRIAALLGFNLGVEAGQLIALAVLLPLLHLLSGWRRAITSVGAAIIGGLGMYWFVMRLL